MQEDGAEDGDHPAAAGRRERRRRERDRRRRAREDKLDTTEAAFETCELADAARACGGCGRASRARSGGGGDGCGCDGPCDLPTLRLSPLLFLAAAVAPAGGADGLVRAAVRAYQRWLSRFTPRCPGTPSCSAFALTAVESLGVRRGLAAAAARVRDCGATPPEPDPAPLRTSSTHFAQGPPCVK